MPKAPIPVGYTKVVGEGIFGPSTWANVFYLDTVASDPAHPTDAMLAAQAAIHAFYEIWHSAYGSGNWAVQTCKCFYRADPTSMYNVTVADAIAGTGSGDYEAAQVSYLVNWGSGDPRRGGKPRQYISGVPIAEMQDSARISSGALAALNAAIATWLGSFPFTHGATGQCHGLVEMSFVSGKVDLNPPIARPILSGTVNPVVGTQRRRADRLRI